MNAEQAIQQIALLQQLIETQQKQIEQLTNQMQTMFAGITNMQQQQTQLQQEQLQQQAQTTSSATQSSGPAKVSSRGFEPIMEPKMLQKMKQFEGTQSTWRSWEFHWEGLLDRARWQVSGLLLGSRDIHRGDLEQCGRQHRAPGVVESDVLHACDGDA